MRVYSWTSSLYEISPIGDNPVGLFLYASKKTATGYSTEKPEWPIPIEKLTVFSLDHARYKSTTPCNGFIIPGFLYTRKLPSDSDLSQFLEIGAGFLFS